LAAGGSSRSQLATGGSSRSRLAAGGSSRSQLAAGRAVEVGWLQAEQQGVGLAAGKAAKVED
jgi:hypothetical protein